MAFNEKNLFSAMGTAGSAPSMFTCISDDSVSTVNTSGYFNKSRGALKNNDYIFVRLADSDDYILRVTSSSLPITTELLTNDIYAINFNFDRSHKAR